MDFEEFNGRLKELCAEFPAEQETVLKAGASKMVRKIRENTPDSGEEHKLKLKKSWRMEMAGFTGKGIRAEIRSVAPHFHLIERGHVIKTPGGKIKGFKQGTFFMKKTVDKNQKEITDEMVEKLYKKVKKKLDG